MLNIRRLTIFGLILLLLFISSNVCKGFRQHDDAFEAVFTRQKLLLKRHMDSNSQRIHEGPGPAKLPSSGEASEKGSSKKVPHSKKPKVPKHNLPHITETTLGNDTHLGAIVTWTNFDSRVIFIITCDHILKHGTKSFCASKSNVYRSFNYGESFDLEQEKFSNTSIISTVFVSPINRRLIFAVDKTNKVMYRSVDEGATYNKTDLAFDPLALAFHPRLLNILLIKDIKNDVYLSNDTGKSWVFMISKVRKFFWSEQKNTSQIFFETVSLQNTKLPTQNYSLVYLLSIPFHGSPHLFDQTLGPIFPNSLLVKGDYIYIQRKTSAGNKRLFVHYKDSSRFEECELPTNELHVDYHFLQGQQDQIILAALAKDRSTNLYIAGKNGKQFSLILKNVEALWGQEEIILDVHKVDDVPGTLIANQVSKGTVISYNNGGLWNKLMPPEYDENGKKVDCFDPNCIFKLSLYIQDNSIIGWSPITASKHVPGVIIAQGTLIKVSNDIHVSLYGYVSTNGGQSWKQGLTGRHIYKLLDHGALFASIAITNPFLLNNTNKVEYSCDEGRTWNFAMLPNQLSRVVGVAAHPAAKSNVLKIFGADISDRQMFAWTIWKVNFSAIFDYECSDGNYTMWTAGPENIGNSCILGQKYVYERKKEGICCSYGIDYQRKTNISLCPCTMADFECDFGFKRDEIGGYCSPTSFASLNPPVNCPEGEEYVQSKGYIKIKGDKCQGGIENEIMPVTKMCPAMAPDGLSLSVQKYSIALGKTSEIVLHQQSGFLGTKYTWDYGDGVKEYNLTFDNSKRYHKYEKVGTYVISVLASNSAGSFTAKTVMRVIERVSEVFLHVTKPVVAMEPASYTAELITHGPTVADRHGFVHFAWIFEPIKTPVLSLNSSVMHTYSSPGTYEVEVRVFNAISVVSATISVTVFGDVRVLQLQFSSTLDLLNQGTKQWNELFKLVVYNYLIKTFKIRREMVEVEVSKTLPTIVTLSLVQNTVPQGKLSGDSKTITNAQKSSVRSLDNVMHEIIDRVKNRTISFFLMGQEVRVLEATVVRGGKEPKSKTAEQHGLSTKAKRSLYIGLTVGGLLFLVCIVYAVFICKKRMQSRKAGTYAEMPEDNDVADYIMNSFAQT